MRRCEYGPWIGKKVLKKSKKVKIKVEELKRGKHRLVLNTNHGLNRRRDFCPNDSFHDDISPTDIELLKNLLSLAFKSSF